MYIDEPLMVQIDGIDFDNGFFTGQFVCPINAVISVTIHFQTSWEISIHLQMSH